MRALFAGILTIAMTASVSAQSGSSSWHRESTSVQPEQRVFHSTTSINLPTAETTQRGLWLFEISHRFLPRFSDGSDALYGLDGPVNMRIALGYGITDRLSVTAGRSNYHDNYDLRLNYGGFGVNNSFWLLRFAVQAGAAWNTEHPVWPSSDSRSVQFYGQAVLNTLVGEKFALGIAPTYVYNAILESDEVEHVLALGVYGQYYFHRIMALIAEWNITERGYYYHYDAASFGIELETGGHFFKIVATNSTALNPTQFAIGTTEQFKPDNWRLGFNITRILKF